VLFRSVSTWSRSHGAAAVRGEMGFGRDAHKTVPVA
jgi:hypothetical protein